MRIIASLTLLLLAALPAAAADMEWVKVSDDNKDFVLSESGKPFIPWGFNYDLEGDGKLIEDYWDDQWQTVASAFQEMKGLGAIAVHIYPETGKVDEAIETLKGFAAVGKPVVIEEIFPLKFGAEELGRFIDESRQYATGWIGFYWGKTPDELRPAKTMPAKGHTSTTCKAFVWMARRSTGPSRRRW